MQTVVKRQMLLVSWYAVEAKITTLRLLKNSCRVDQVKSVSLNLHCFGWMSIVQRFITTRMKMCHCLYSIQRMHAACWCEYSSFWTRAFFKRLVRSCRISAPVCNPSKPRHSRTPEPNDMWHFNNRPKERSVGVPKGLMFHQMCKYTQLWWLPRKKRNARSGWLIASVYAAWVCDVGSRGLEMAEPEKENPRGVQITLTCVQLLKRQRASHPVFKDEPNPSWGLYGACRRPPFAEIRGQDVQYVNATMIATISVMHLSDSYIK